MEIASPERIWLGKRWHLHLRDHRLRGFQVPREFDIHPFWLGDLEVQIDMDQMVKLQTFLSSQYQSNGAFTKP